MAQVVLSHVKKVYSGGGVAVDDFCLTVPDREFLVLVGPSGCGKSTTLRMVAGLEEISGGTIAIDGRVVNACPPKDRDIAMVFQNYALYPHMTVRENMAFGLKLRHTAKAEINARIDEAADVLGLQDYLTRLPRQLSGGQRQRVALGRAIVRKPKVFLFDEPLSNLDAKMRVEMRDEIHRLHHRLQATILYVTHDQTEAMTLGNRIVVMEQGKIRQVADPLTLYHHPANKFTAGFIGMPPMNFIDGVCRADERFETAAGILQLPSSYHAHMTPGRELTFGVRPEDAALQMAEAPFEGGIKATVEIVEQMGAEAFVHFIAGNSRLTVRTPAQSALHHGAVRYLAPDTAHSHLFDPATGDALI